MVRVINLYFLILIVFPVMANVRVASFTLCADQTVAALVEPEHIVALSPQAHNRRISAVAKQVKSLPTLPATAEAFILVNTDIVVGMAQDKTRTLDMVERLGTSVVRLKASEDFSTIISQLQIAAVALDMPIQGKKLVTDLEQRLSKLNVERLSQSPQAAYIRSDGGSAGNGTFIDAVLRAAGFENFATAIGHEGWGRLDLETLVMNHPEVIVTAFFDSHDFTFSRWPFVRRFARHPAFRSLLQQIPVIEAPSALITCGTWPLIEAAEFLSYHYTNLLIRTRNQP